jgi:uncharacterized coiled-coil DUF342 family protein
MLRSLLKWGALLIIGVLVYNRYFGTAEEKERSKKIGNQTRVLFQDVRDVVRDEREKFNEGKYDKAISKVKNVIGKVRETANDNKDILDELEGLDQKRKDIEARLEKIKSMPDDVPATYDKLTEKGGSSTKPMPKITNPKSKTTTKTLTKAEEQQKLETEMDDLVKDMNELESMIEKNN